MTMSYTQQNLDVAKELIFATEDEFKEKSEKFLKQNSRLIAIIASGLFNPRKDYLNDDYDDVVAYVQLATLETLRFTTVDACDYLSRGTFWKVVKNKAKSYLHTDQGTGVNYSTMKTLVRNGALDFCEIIHEDSESAERHGAKTLKSAEETFFDNEVRAEFEGLLDSLSDVERKAIECRKYADFDEPLSRRTYSRIRSRVREKIRAGMSFSVDDYYTALTE